MNTPCEDVAPNEAEPVPAGQPYGREKKTARRRQALLILTFLLVGGGMAFFAISRYGSLRWVSLHFPPAKALFSVRYRHVSDPLAARFVEAARAQIGTRYDAGYQTIAYPGGDVPKSRGACTDVVVRALRAGGFDLQKLIHEDMMRHRSAYPNSWGAGSINANIDHRRVPNQIAFLRRHGRELTRQVGPAALQQWQPGDLVYWRTGRDKWHTGVLSDGIDGYGVPLVIHNGSICAEDNCLTRWPIIGHFRYPH